MGDAGPIEADLPSVREEVPVLIIGGGPAGLLEAFILTQLGGENCLDPKYVFNVLGKMSLIEA